MRTKTLSKLKKELDKWFSLYIRLRECNEYGMVQCFTSGRVYHYKKSAADNLFGQGEQFRFGLNLDAKYGDGTAEQLQYKSRLTIKFSRTEIEEKISYYKSLVNKIKEQKQIE